MIAQRTGRPCKIPVVRTDSKLMDMLTGYAAAHRHPLNIAIHMVGIPVIMLGVLIPLSWGTLEVNEFRINFAHLALIGFFLFYLTLDWIFALVFLVFGYLLTLLAIAIGDLGTTTSGIIAAVLFFGGYLAQFIGHAVEKSAPVILKHPVQANLAAPLFTVVEAFKLLGLRDSLFNEVRRRIDENR